MASSNGYGSTSSTSNLVFAYDIGDVNNCYLGEPTVNLANTDASRTLQQYADNTVASADAPERGPGWKKVTITARGTNFRTAKFPYITQPTSTIRTYSLEIDFNGTSGYYIRGDGFSGFSPNQYTSGIYTSTFTTTSNSGVLALFLNNNTTSVTGINDVIYYRYYQVENKLHRTPFTEGTRSATQGLLDLTGNVAIDLNNVSFNSNAQITFDGTDDYINLSPASVPTGNEISVELICAWNGSLQANSIIAGGAGGNQDLSLHLPWSDGNVYWDAGRPFNRIYKYANSSEYLGNHHWVCTKNANTGNMSIFLDGNLWHSGEGLTSSLPSLDSASIGRYDNGVTRAYYYKGNAFVVKIYNKALVLSEVQNNYQNYKSRFNLP